MQALTADRNFLRKFFERATYACRCTYTEELVVPKPIKLNAFHFTRFSNLIFAGTVRQRGLLRYSIKSRQKWSEMIECRFKDSEFTFDGENLTDSPLTRASLVFRLRDSTDDDAWTEFLDLYGPMIYRFAVSRGLQDADATDLVQDVLRRVEGSIRRFDYAKEKGGFRAWLFTITRNCLNTFFEKKQRTGTTGNDTDQLKMLNQIPDETDELHALWEHEYQLQLMTRAMQTIRLNTEPNTWAAFDLTAIQNIPAEEVGTKIGISRGAVYVARSRVTARLRAEVERLMEEEQ